MQSRFSIEFNVSDYFIIYKLWTFALYWQRCFWKNGKHLWINCKICLQFIWFPFIIHYWCCWLQSSQYRPFMMPKAAIWHRNQDIGFNGHMFPALYILFYKQLINKVCGQYLHTTGCIIDEFDHDYFLNLRENLEILQRC